MEGWKGAGSELDSRGHENVERPGPSTGQLGLEGGAVGLGALVRKHVQARTPLAELPHPIVCCQPGKTANEGQRQAREEWSNCTEGGGRDDNEVRAVDADGQQVGEEGDGLHRLAEPAVSTPS